MGVDGAGINDAAIGLPREDGGEEPGSSWALCGVRGVRPLVPGCPAGLGAPVPTALAEGWRQLSCRADAVLLQ